MEKIGCRRFLNLYQSLLFSNPKVLFFLSKTIISTFPISPGDDMPGLFIQVETLRARLNILTRSIHYDFEGCSSGSVLLPFLSFFHLNLILFLSIKYKIQFNFHALRVNYLVHATSPCALRTLSSPKVAF